MTDEHSSSNGGRSVWHNPLSKAIEREELAAWDAVEKSMRAMDLYAEFRALTPSEASFVKLQGPGGK